MCSWRWVRCVRKHWQQIFAHQKARTIWSAHGLGLEGLQLLRLTHESGPDVALPLRRRWSLCKRSHKVGPSVHRGLSRVHLRLHFDVVEKIVSRAPDRSHPRPRGETRRMVSPVYELHVASGRGARDAFEPPRVFLMHSRDMPTSFPPRLGSSHAPLPRAWSFSTPLPDRPRTPMPPRGRALLLADACSSSSWRSLSLASSPTTAEPIFSPANMLREELLRPAGTPASASKRSPSCQRSRSPSRTDTRSRGSISSHLYAPCSRHGQARPACRPAAAGAPRGVSRRYSKREITALAEKARRAVLQGSEAEREEQRNLVMSPSQLMPALCAPRSLTV